MNSSSFTAFLPAVLGAASIALVSSAFSAPANAYSVVLNGRTAGNPGGALYDVILNQGDIGRTLDPVKWLVPAGTSNGKETTPIALGGRATIKVDDLQSSFLSLTISLLNTTNLASVGSNYRADLVSFGFGVSPDATSVQLTQAGKVFDNAIVQTKNQNFPGSFKNIDICIFANGCNGGGNEGLKAGQSDTFTLKIFGNFGASPSTKVTLSDFPAKFQTDNGSYEPAGVPEPITVVGSGIALGFGALFKQQVSKKRRKGAVKS